MKVQLVYLAAVIMSGVVRAEVVINFDGLRTSKTQGYDLPNTDGIHDWTQQGVCFSRTTSYDGAFWDGMTFSSVNDTVSSGYMNQFAVYGNGRDRSGTGVYAVFFQPFEQRSIIQLPVETKVNGFYLNNTTYTALAMLNGESPARAFTTDSGDWFKLTVEGFDSDTEYLGAVEFLLADYSQGMEQLIAEWSWMDLTGLGDRVRSLSFGLSSTDNGRFGMNTPAYFAMDDLSLEAVPEPEVKLLLFIGLGGLLWLRRFRRNRA